MSISTSKTDQGERRTRKTYTSADPTQGSMEQVPYPDGESNGAIVSIKTESMPGSPVFKLGSQDTSVKPENQIWRDRTG